MTPEQIFSANFHRLLAANNRPAQSDQIAAQLNKWNSGIYLSDGAIACWLYGNELPRWTSFEMLSEWLGCEPAELLPAEHWHLLKGYGAAAKPVEPSETYRRMVAEWEAKLKEAAEAGDEAAFLHVETELKNYRAMLAQSCPALSDGHSPNTPCR